MLICRIFYSNPLKNHFDPYTKKTFLGQFEAKNVDGFLPQPRMKQKMIKRRSLVLPREIWSIIFQKLDTPTLRKIASLVCKDWLNIIRYLGNK